MTHLLPYSTRFQTWLLNKVLAILKTGLIASSSNFTCHMLLAGAPLANDVRSTTSRLMPMHFWTWTATACCSQMIRDLRCILGKLESKQKAWSALETNLAFSRWILHAYSCFIPVLQQTRISFAQGDVCLAQEEICGLTLLWFIMYTSIFRRSYIECKFNDSAAFRCFPAPHQLICQNPCPQKSHLHLTNHNAFCWKWPFVRRQCVCYLFASACWYYVHQP